MFGAETGLSSQRTCFPWIRGCVWPCGLARNFGSVRGGSPDHHGTRHAHDATRRRAEVWDGAPSGAAKRANRTASGTPHRTHRAASRAAHRTRGTTRRARRRQHYDHRAKKVVGSFGPTKQPGRLSAGPGSPYSALGARSYGLRGGPGQRIGGGRPRLRLVPALHDLTILPIARRAPAGFSRHADAVVCEPSTMRCPLLWPMADVHWSPGIWTFDPWQMEDKSIYLGGGGSAPI